MLTRVPRVAARLVHHLGLRLAGPLGARKPLPCAVFQVTAACDGRCTTCHVGLPGYRAPYPPPSLHAALHVVRELSRHGVLFLGVVGGEPLLYRHVMEVLGEASHLGVQTNLNTHGGLVTPEVARELDRVRLGYASVSLDSPDPVSNDRGRPGTTFAGAARALDLLRTHSPRTSLAVGMTVTRENRSQLADMVRTAADLGAGFVKFQPMHLHLDQAPGAETAGLPVDPRAGLVPDEQDWPALQAELVRAQRLADARGVVCNARMLLQEFPAVLAGRRTLPCVAGRSVVYVDAGGRVGGCPQRMTRASLFQRTLAELLADEADVFRHADGCAVLGSCYDTTYGELSHLQGRRGSDHARNVLDRARFYV
jgi:MoaA/NifB/PqqE/SkfB family radical SAM enzyme